VCVCVCVDEELIVARHVECVDDVDDTHLMQRDQ